MCGEHDVIRERGQGRRRCWLLEAKRENHATRCSMSARRLADTKHGLTRFMTAKT
jgi:hypothetical protein